LINLLTHYYTTYCVSHSCQNSEVIHIRLKKNQAFKVLGQQTCSFCEVLSEQISPAELRCQYIVSTTGFMMTGEGGRQGAAD